MRQIGTLPEDQARPFADYLLTQGITSRLDCGPKGCAVWVHQEDFVDRARDALHSYQKDPDNPRFQRAHAEAEAIRRREMKADREHARKTVDLRARIGSRASSFGPLTRWLIIVSVAVFLLGWLGFSIGGQPLDEWLYFTDWGRAPDGQAVNLGLRPILHGQVWRLITPIFVHGGPLHLFFNMYMMFQLGTLIERRRSTAELAAIVLVTAIVSNVAQFYMPNLFTVPSARLGDAPFGGMSGVIFGLFGYAWMRGKYDPASGMRLHPNTVAILLIWLVVCAFNLLGPIANTAHVVGMLAGMGFAFVSLWRDNAR